MKQIELKELKEVYHASNHLFDKPDIEIIKRNRKNHENGMLGLFFSTTKDKWFHTFGKYIYHITIPKHFTPLIMPLDEFMKLSRADSGNVEEYFAYHRDRFLKSGIDYILIEEANGGFSMGVFINLNIEMRLIHETN